MAINTNELPWRGFHHVALVTPDLDETISFYQDVVGMQAGEIYQARQGKSRHCFIKPGESEAWGLHFFEDPEAPVSPRLETLSLQWSAFLPGSLQHIAFALPNEATALTLRERLRERDVAMTEIGAVSTIRNMVFQDNNGILLEAAWPNDANAS
jgi:catechol 2,3-dioxygenase-like lactoylglutathione lyase family enzyme